MFLKMDLKVGYQQIKMNLEDVEKRAIRFHEGRCEL